MIDIIYSKNNIIKNNIKILLPYRIDKKIAFNIFYKDRNPLLIQTPLCSIPYKYMIYDDKYFQMNLFIDSKEFTELIEFITTYIINKISKKFSKLIFNKKLIKPFIKVNNDINNDNNDIILKLINYNVDSILLFDNSKNIIDIRNIEKNDQVKAIIQVERFIIDTDSYSFTIKIIQLLKKCEIDLFSQKKYLFIEEDNEKKNKEKEEENEIKYLKFSKMFKIGVPIIAIKQKMTLEGFTEDDFNIFSYKININSKISIVHKIPLPPPLPPLLPPPLPPPLPFSSLIKPLAFLNDIKNKQFTLKKTEKVKDKILLLVDKNKLVPSLEDIINAKSHLKSTKYI